MDDAAQSRFERLATGVAGVAFVVLATAAFFLHREGGATPEEFWGNLSGSAAAVQWQVYLYALAGIPFTAFFTLLAQRLNTASPHDAFLGWMVVSGAAMSYVMVMVWGITRVAVTRFLQSLPESEPIGPGWGQLLDLGDIAMTAAGMAAAIVVFGLAAGVLRTRILPAAYAAAGLGVLVLLLVNGALQFRTHSGDLSQLGDTTFLVFLAWSLAGAVLASALPAKPRAREQSLLTPARTVGGSG